MMKWIELNPDERAITKRGNHYKVAGPGVVWVLPGQQVLTKFNIGIRGERIQLNAVQTMDNVPVDITAQVLYRVDPSLFRSESLHLIPGLNDGGWLSVLRWRTEAVVRRVLVGYDLADMSQPSTQDDQENPIELQLRQKLSRYMNSLGIQITGVCLIKAELPAALSKKYVQTTQDTVEMQWRATMVKTYLDQFNGNLEQAMPFIRWELTNALQKQGGPHLMLTNSDPFASTPIPPPEQPGILINWPAMPPKGEGVSVKG